MATIETWDSLRRRLAALEKENERLWKMIEKIAADGYKYPVAKVGLDAIRAAEKALDALDRAKEETDE